MVLQSKLHISLTSRKYLPREDKYDCNRFVTFFQPPGGVLFHVTLAVIGKVQSFSLPFF